MVAEIRSETAKVRAVIKYLSAEEGARRLADAEEMHRRDIVDRVEGAREEGRLEGFEEGLMEVMQEPVRKLLFRKMSYEEIAEITGLPIAAIMSLEKGSPSR